MSKIFAGFMIAAFLMSAISLSARADDVIITNQSKQPARFEVFVGRTVLYETFIVQPGESKNPLGRSLLHDMLVVIYAYDSSSKVDCGLSVYQARLPYKFYHLPRVSGAYSYRTCEYKSNLPALCDCFLNHSEDEPCFYKCTAVSNAQVELIYGSKQVDAP